MTNTMKRYRRKATRKMQESSILYYQDNKHSIHQDDANGYIANKVTHDFESYDLTDAMLLTRYIEVITNGVNGKYYDDEWMQVIREEIDTANL